MTRRFGLAIRTATATDTGGLAELLHSAGQHIAPHLIAERLDGVHRSPGCALIAEEWGPPSGVILAHWYRSLLTAGPIAQINLLLVAPEARRRGIGRLLVKAAAHSARVAGCDALELRCRPGQPELAAFGQATGFVADGGVAVRSLRRSPGQGS